MAIEKKEVVKEEVKPKFPIMGKNISGRKISLKAGLVIPGDSIELTQNEYQNFHRHFEFDEGEE